MFEFKLPDLGEGIHEAEILKWFVAEGDEIAEDADLVEVETDKAAVTIPSPRGGRVSRLAGAVGDQVVVGQILAVIGGPAGEGAGKEGAAATAAAKTTTGRAPRTEGAAEVAEPAEGTPGAGGPGAGGPVPAAPATRRLARELGVDLALVKASGPGGRVTVEDLRRFAGGKEGKEEGVGKGKEMGTGKEREGEKEMRIVPEARCASIPLLDLDPLPDFSCYGPVEVEALRSIRRKVARKMVTSMILVPHVAHMDEADVTELEAFRLKEREKRSDRPGGQLTLLPFVVKAVTAGLKAAPAFNASLDPFREEIIYKKYFNVGVAVDTGHGLVVPVIRSTDRKSIIEIATDLEGLAVQARDGSIDVEAFRGGTFTITNVGPLGGTAMIPTINYPEVAILGMGRVQEKPVVRHGEIVIRKMLPLTLAFDHRIADGADAARFVHELIRRLSDPNLLMLES